MRLCSSAPGTAQKYEPLDKHPLRQQAMWDEDGRMEEVLPAKPFKVDGQGSAPPPGGARPVLLGRCRTQAAPTDKKLVMVWGPDGELMVA